MALKRLHPDSSNRNEVIAATLNEILRGETKCRSLIAHNQRVCREHWLPANHVEGVIGACAGVFYDQMSLAIPKLWHGDHQGVQLLGNGAGSMYLAARLDFCDLKLITDGFNFENPVLKHLLIFHGLLAKVGDNSMPKWFAPHLLKLLDGKASDLLRQIDEPFVEFMRLLVQAQIVHKWPEEVDSRALRGFAPLLQFAGGGDKFRRVLEDYCDFRLCNAWGWNEVDARNPRKPSQSFPSSIFDGPGWEALLPFELFSLQYVYESCTGMPLPLNADHPLLHSKLMALPPVWPFPESELVAEVEIFGAGKFGESWHEK
ncbi:MAG: hypothetical protein OJI67_19650 [Prosthecobacter sp.]|nr:hypothetical protein [Prosthecobacter sp.]